MSKTRFVENELFDARMQNLCNRSVAFDSCHFLYYLPRLRVLISGRRPSLPWAARLGLPDALTYHAPDL